MTHVSEADRTYIEEQMNSIEGWLIPEAAYLTAYLMNFQASELDVRGAVCEIGVYQGKYLMLLHHLSRRDDSLVVGVDTFQQPSQIVLDHCERLFSSLDRLKLITADSRSLTVRDLRQALGGQKARFISVDGDHRAPGVTGDIELSEGLLEDSGIIAVDDFLNPRAIGVSEGTYRYFFEHPTTTLVPFVYSANKLFLCRRGCYEKYHASAFQFTQEVDLPHNRSFQELMKRGSHWVDFDLLGAKVLVI